MTFTWMTGINREIDPHHVDQLHSLFHANGLQRNTPENYIQALCCADDLEALSTLDLQQGEGPIEDQSTLMANPLRKVEVIAG